MVPASQPFLAYVFLPACPGPLPLLSQGGGRTSASHWIRAWASPNKWVAIEKQAHTIRIWSRKRPYIQPIVLQEGVHTIHHFA